MILLLHLQITCPCNCICHLIGGQDYDIPLEPYFRVKFPAGYIRASFDINLIDDGEIEGSETFRVYIFDLSVPYGVSLRHTTSAAIIIANDDSK